MYIVEFLQKEQSKTFKKFLRKNKAGNGKQLGLLTAEILIQRYVEQYQQSDRILLLLQDVENEKAYEFELPVSTGQAFSLLAAISNDLEKETDFTLAMEIKQGMYESYKDEENQGAVVVEEGTLNKKKGGFLSKIFGKKSEDNVTDVKKDFAEPMNDFSEMLPEEMGIRSSSLIDESEIEGLEKEAIDLSKEEDIFAIEEEFNGQSAAELNLENNVEELPFGIGDNDATNNVEHEVSNLEIENGMTNKKFAEPAVVIQTKDVTFPDYAQYLDLSELKVKQERYDSRFSLSHLLGLLGINEETSITDLEMKKLQYAKKILSGKDFLIIQDRYYQDVNNVIDEIRLALEKEYEAVVMPDYSKEAENRLREVFEDNRQSVLELCEEFVHKEDQEINQKVRAFVEKQQLELESYKLQQDADLKAYQSELEDRKLALVRAREEELMQENDKKQKKELEDEIYNIKVAAEKKLIDLKNESLTGFSNALEEIMNDAFLSHENQLSNLQGDIERLVPMWKEEVEAEHNRKLEERKLTVEEDKNRLEKESLALKIRQQEALDMKGSQRVRELQDIIEDLNDKLQKAYLGLGQQPAYQQPMYQQPVYQQPMYQQPVQQQPAMQTQPENPSKKRKGFLARLVDAE